LEVFTGIDALMQAGWVGGESCSGGDAGAFHDLVGKLEVAVGGVGGALVLDDVFPVGGHFVDLRPPRKGGVEEDVRVDGLKFFPLLCRNVNSRISSYSPSTGIEQRTETDRWL